MSQGELSAGLTNDDFVAIEAAVRETERGRWFLDEFAKRNRHAETVQLLGALARIEGNVTAARVQDHTAEAARMRRELADIGEMIARSRDHMVAAASDARDVPIERVFDDVVRAAQQAEQDVLRAAEKIQEVAWGMRQNRSGGAACEELDRQALEIYRASNQHALAADRIRGAFGVLRAIERRVTALIGEPGSETKLNAARSIGRTVPSRARLTAAPSPVEDDIGFVERSPGPPRATSKPDAPAFVDDDGLVPKMEAAVSSLARSEAVLPLPDPNEDRGPPPADPQQAESVRAEPPQPSDPRIDVFAAVDALAPEQKLALFV